MLSYQEYGEIKGSSQVVILLHGLLGQSDNLALLAKALAENFRVIIPDLINHGDSPHRSDMSYASMAGDVMTVLRHLQLDRVKLFGHSMGGKVAMQMALDYPDSVASVIVADIAPVDYSESHNSIFMAMRKVASTQVDSRSQADLILAKTIADQALRQFILKSLRRNKDGNWQWCYGLEEIISAYPAICAFPATEKTFHNPILFIKGSESDYINESHQRQIRRYFTQPSLKIIQGAGHWLHVEKPLAFNRVVKDFFSTSLDMPGL